MTKKELNRRDFVGSTTAALAASIMVGCKTTNSVSEGKDAAFGDFLGQVVTARIHPGIGVARIGNSEGGFFIGPEVTTPELTKAGASRDATGALKRQAARFRIYGYDAQGKVLGEITADLAEIEWRVHLANKKAQWYRFLAALDIPEAAEMQSPRRNAQAMGEARKKLAIDPGARKIKGKGQQGAAFQFNGAQFLEQPVSLGEVRTDDKGRLLVFGGKGKAGSPLEAIIFDPNDGDSFNNADSWYDDIADGPVSATLKIGGNDVPVDPAWVFVAPPNYAPDVIGWRTLYDLLTDTYIEAGMLPFPERTSFTRDVLPALARLSNLQWVNRGFQLGYGPGSPFPFEDGKLLEKLAAKVSDPATDATAELRAKVFAFFRTNANLPTERKTWPWMYGDAFGSFQGSTRVNLALSGVRARHLKRWVEGDFDADYDPAAKSPTTIDELPLAQQPAMLDQAPLHFCLADAFHPGCEVTWPMRHASLYRAPYRIKQRPAEEPEADYGANLTQEICLKEGGPLYAQGPGDLTKWMAIPWQGDTAFCRSGYEPDVDPFILTFWPARVPNQVLSDTEYQIVMNTNLPRQKRLDAFNKRRSWVRGLTGGAPAQMQQMIDGFHKLGVVEARPGVANDPDFPAVMLVESLAPALGVGLALTRGEKDWAPQNKFEAAGWESEAQLKEFRKILGFKK